MAGKKGRSGRKRLPDCMLPPDSRQRDRRGGPDVKAPDEAMRMPPKLSKDEQAEWRFLVPRLQEMRVVARLDTDVIVRLCWLRARCRKLMAFVERYGDTYPEKDAAGAVKRMVAWPQVNMLTQTMSQLANLEREFGLTPSSRASLKIAAPDQPKGETKADKFGLVG
ncbi:MAG: phage terminase small subunit P27 family [Chloroflexia bacterium]|nr:phage terminase small subunit P27 family [Chloroflexia bacterium]